MNPVYQTIELSLLRYQYSKFSHSELANIIIYGIIT